MRTELVDYIVAHSEYSTPLMRPDLLSALISGGEDGPDGVLPAAGAPGPVDTTGPTGDARPHAAAGDLDATSPAPANSR